MKLSETWFIEGYVDFELQKYRLLNYLKEVQTHFDALKLYPHLSDVIAHYNNLMNFKVNKQFLENQFSKRLDAIDTQKLEMLYKKMLADDELMLELESITDYSVSQMKNTIDSGAEIYDFVEAHTHIEAVGIVPLYKKEGYVLLSHSDASIHIYYYIITLFDEKNARFRGIQLQYIESLKKTIINTNEQVKRDIVKRLKALPNPAVFCVETTLDIPLDETLLPIAKRMLMKQLANAA